MIESALLLENQICFRIYSLERAIHAAYKPLLAKFDLTYPQYLVMLVLWEVDSATVGDICSSLRLDTGTISPLIKRMELKGLVERKRLPFDERTVMVCLTKKGQNLQQEAKYIPHQLASCLFNQNGKSDQAAYEQLRTVLDDALISLEKSNLCCDTDENA